MSAAPRTIYLIGGCNGAGKTTFALEFLSKEVKCLRFLNADEIAKGLSPLSPTSSAVRAARVLLQEIRINISNRESFGLESTLSGVTYARVLRFAKSKGYSINIYYLWLRSSALAIRRVGQRVRKGGHAVPFDDVRRRFNRSIYNFFRIYIPLADSWTLFDNSGQFPRLIAEAKGNDLKVANTELFARVLKLKHHAANEAKGTKTKTSSRER